MSDDRSSERDASGGGGSTPPPPPPSQPWPEPQHEYGAPPPGWGQGGSGYPPQDNPQQGYQQPGYGPPGYAPQWQQQPPYAQTATSTNGMAIASLVLGILWIWWIGSTLALIFGYISKKQIDDSRGQQGGRGMAIAGIVLGWIGISFLVIAFAVGFMAGLRDVM